MTCDLEQLIGTCEACQRLQSKNQYEALLSHTIPELLWIKIGPDIFELEDHSYLVLVDYFFPQVLHLPEKTAHTVIRKMKCVFVRNGIPKKIVSDHVPFASHEMRMFAAEWGITLIHYSLGYPQSNGLAERTVQTVKQVFKKAASTGVDPHLALLSVSNTPVTGMSFSTTQMLMGRALRGTLPATAAVQKPATPKGIHSRLMHLQGKQHHYYNATAKPLSNLSVGSMCAWRQRKGGCQQKLWRRERSHAHHGSNWAALLYRKSRHHLRLAINTWTDTSQEPESPDARNQQDQHLLNEEWQEVTATPVSTTHYHNKSGRVIQSPVKLKDYVVSKC